MNRNLATRIDALLWHPRLAGLRGPARMGLDTLRFVYAVLRDIFRGELTLRAMGLVYVTILSIVPVLAISFSVLKAFGFHRQLEPLLYNLLLPLGERGAELTDQVIGFVDNVQGNLLAGLGLALLFFTTLSMAQKVEDSFNHVWRVNRPRAIGKRFSEYFAVLLVGPVVMVTAIALLAALRSTFLIETLADWRFVRLLADAWGQLAPYLLVCAAFSFIYWFVPNTRVTLRAAVAGGIVGGILWATSAALFAAFVAGSTQALTIYATFAIVIIALIWLHLCWLILLIGAQVAFYVQHPEYLQLGYRDPGVSARQREQIALTAMLVVGQSFRGATEPVTEDGLAAHMRLPVIVLNPVLDRLTEAGLLTRTTGNQLMPAREPAQIMLREILFAVREPAQGTGSSGARWPAPVKMLVGRIQSALEQSLGEETLAGFLDRAEQPATGAAPAQGEQAG